MSDWYLGICWRKNKVLNLDRRENHQQMVHFLRRWIILARDMFWRPIKLEIQQWVDFKALEFAREENEGSWLNPAKWLERYLYTDIHEIFFFEFHILLYEWFFKWPTQWKKFQERESREWSPQLIQQLKRTSNPISKSIDFLVDSILGGYITKVIIDTIRSYSEVEREFFQGPIGRYLTSLKIGIKMLACEKGILIM